MPALAGREREKKQKLEVLRRPFANTVTKQMLEKHAAQLQIRLDRKKAETAENYRREYNLIAGRASAGGASAAHTAAVATRNFVATHGARHLPK